MANPLPVEDSLKEEQITERERQRCLVASLPRTSDEKILLAGVCSQLLDAQFWDEETLQAMKGITIPPGVVNDVALGLSAIAMYHFSSLPWTDSRNYLFLFSTLHFSCSQAWMTNRIILFIIVMIFICYFLRNRIITVTSRGPKNISDHYRNQPGSAIGSLP